MIGGGGKKRREKREGEEKDADANDHALDHRHESQMWPGSKRRSMIKS